VEVKTRVRRYAAEAEFDTDFPEEPAADPDAGRDQGGGRPGAATRPLGEQCSEHRCRGRRHDTTPGLPPQRRGHRRRARPPARRWEQRRRTRTRPHAHPGYVGHTESGRRSLISPTESLPAIPLSIITIITRVLPFVLVPLINHYGSS
jgi:hypothetical protein